MEEKNNKLSWVGLRQAVADKAGTTDKETGIFLQAFTEELTQALKQGESVRISGLGTFRVQTTAARQSVNIATGNKITIEGGKRLSFVSDLHAKQSVNDTLNTPAIDPLKKLNEQAEEIKDILADLIPQSEPVEVEEEVQVEEEVKEEVKVEVKEEIKEEITEEVKVEVKEEEEEEKQPQPKKEQKPFRPWMVAGITMTIFALLLICGYLFLQHKIEQWVNRLSERTEQTNPIIDELNDEAPAQWEVTDTETTEEPAAFIPAEQPVTYPPREYKRFIKTEALSPGSRLAWVAYKYYGNKDLWVFIYEANRDRLKHPSQIVVGTRIRIPELDDELRDTNNPATRALIDQLQAEFLSQPRE